MCVGCLSQEVYAGARCNCFHYQDWKAPAELKWREMIAHAHVITTHGRSGHRPVRIDHCGGGGHVNACLHLRHDYGGYAPTTTCTYHLCTYIYIYILYIWSIFGYRAPFSQCAVGRYRILMTLPVSTSPCPRTGLFFGHCSISSGSSVSASGSRTVAWGPSFC